MQLDFHATVFGASFGRFVVSDRNGFAVAVVSEKFRIDSLFNQKVYHGLRPFDRKQHLVFMLADVGGVSSNKNRE